MRKTMIFTFLWAVLSGSFILADWAGSSITLTFSPAPLNAINGFDMSMTFLNGDGTVKEVFQANGAGPVTSHSQHLDAPINHTFGQSEEFSVGYYADTNSLLFNFMGMEFECNHFNYLDILNGRLDYAEVQSGDGVDFDRLQLVHRSPDQSMPTVTPMSQDVLKIFNPPFINELGSSDTIEINGWVSMASVVDSGGIGIFSLPPAGWNSFSITLGSFADTPSVTPEPGTMLIFGLAGVMAFPLLRNRFRKVK